MQIDDRIVWHPYGVPLSAKIGADKSLWGALGEKAFAKFIGNYEALTAGNTGMAMSAINGGPSFTKFIA